METSKPRIRTYARLNCFLYFWNLDISMYSNYLIILRISICILTLQKIICWNSCLFKPILITNFNWHLQNRYYTVNLQFNIKILNFIEYANGQNRSKDAFKGNGRLTVCVLFAIFWKEIMFTTPFRSSYHVNIEAKRGFKIWDRIILTAQK